MRNDLDLNISTFPTILIYPKHDKKNPIKYDMIRDYDVLLNFLEERKLGEGIYEKPVPEGLKRESDMYTQ
jgi:hypothetical protein